MQIYFALLYYTTLFHCYPFKTSVLRQKNSYCLNTSRQGVLMILLFVPLVPWYPTFLCSCSHVLLCFCNVVPIRFCVLVMRMWGFMKRHDSIEYVTEGLKSNKKSQFWISDLKILIPVLFLTLVKCLDSSWNVETGIRKVVIHY